MSWKEIARQHRERRAIVAWMPREAGWSWARIARVLTDSESKPLSVVAAKQLVGRYRNVIKGRMREASLIVQDSSTPEGRAILRLQRAGAIRPGRTGSFRLGDMPPD